MRRHCWAWTSRSLIWPPCSAGVSRTCFRRSTRPGRPVYWPSPVATLGFRHPMIRAALYDEIPAPMRAAWHREAGRALAQADAPADRVARQLLPGGRRASRRPQSRWTSGFCAGWTATASLLVGQAPRAAAELLGYAVAKSPADSAQHDRLICRLAEALYRVGDASEAERVAQRGLAATADPDLLVDLHWTLAQCRTLAGRFSESLATLQPGPGPSRDLSPEPGPAAGGHRADPPPPRPGREWPVRSLRRRWPRRPSADDDWAVGWALHVLTNRRGHAGRR